MTQQPPSSPADRPERIDDRWHVQLLGDVVVRRFGQPLEGWKTTKCKLLLGVLAMNIGQQFPRDTLAELLWGDESEDPERALRTELNRLKDLLTPRPKPSAFAHDEARHAPRGAAEQIDPYDHRRRHASLRADYFEVDVSHFEEAVSAARARVDRADFLEHAEGALAFYRGPFMAGPLVDSVSMGIWIDEQRTRLERMALDLLRDLIEGYEHAGAYERMLDAAARAIDLAPDREWPYRALMRANAARGELQTALAVFGTLEATMREEGLPVSTEVEALATALRADLEHPIEPWRPVDDAPGAPSRPTAPSGLVALLATTLEQRPAEAKAGDSGHADDPERAAEIVARILQHQAERLQGVLLTGKSGPTHLCALHYPLDALWTAVSGTRTLSVMSEAPTWSMGVHVGALAAEDDRKEDPPLFSEAAALAAAAAPGQILVSDLARALAEPDLPTDLWFDIAGHLALVDKRPVEPVYTLRSKETRLTPFPYLGTPMEPTTPPRPADPFFGRGLELAEIEHDFVERGERLVTLHGPGGIGKTRLAIQAADAVSGALELAPRWVDLSAHGDDRGVATAIADALGPPVDTRQDVRQVILKRLKATPTLLLIDNAEQIVDTVAEQVDDLLRSVPSVRVLVTSRRLLRLTAERALEIGPLPVATRPEPTESDLAAAEALFVARARATVRDFDAELHEDEIRMLCHMLEGIPLAIELAAALAAVLDPGQMIERLEDRFKLLDASRAQLPSRRDLPERHRSLRAAIDTSWALLPPDARRLFAQASIFRGGFTLEALEAVTDVPNGLERLAALRDGAMLRAVHGGPELRFRSLETLREYAAERLDELAEPHEIEALRSRHAEHFLHLSEEALPELGPSPVKSIWLRMLDEERENLRVALRWLDAQDKSASPESVSHGLRMSGALWRYWFERGRLSEGRDHVERFLAETDPADGSLEHALALHAAGTLTGYLGEHREAIRLLESSLAIRRQRMAEHGDAYGDERMLAYTINNVGVMALQVGDYPRAAKYIDESIRRKRASGDVLHLTTSLDNLAGIYFILGKRRAMESTLEELLEIAEESEQPDVIARVHHHRGVERVHHGDYAGARTLFELARRGLGHEAESGFHATHRCRNIGQEAHWSARFDEAARHYEQALALAREYQNRSAEAEALRFLGELALDRGELDTAETRLRESLHLGTSDGMRLSASGAQYVLGKALVHRGDLEQARTLLLRSLRYRAELGSILPIAETLEAWSQWLAVAGEAALARRTAGAFQRLRREHGLPSPAHHEEAQARIFAEAGIAPPDADDPPPEETEWRGVVAVLLGLGVDAT